MYGYDNYQKRYKAKVSFVMSRIAKEDARDGPRSEFMRSTGGHVWVAFATEDSQVIVCRWCAEDGKMQCEELESLGGQNVKKRGLHGEGLDPIGERHRCLKEQGVNDIIHGANVAFGFTILMRSVGARHTKMDALSEEKVTDARVELFPVIALDNLDLGAKLNGGVGDEVTSVLKVFDLRRNGKVNKQ